MPFLSIYIYQLIFAIFSLTIAWGNQKYMLSDGLMVLRYVCYESWKTSRATEISFIKFITSGIWSYIYPSWMHCGLNPPHIFIFLLNQIFIFLNIWLSCKYIKNTYFRIILLFSLIYSSYSSGVASKEAFISLLLTTLSILLISVIEMPFKLNKLKNFFKKYNFLIFFILLNIFLLFITRPSYFILFPIIIYAYLYGYRINNISNKVLLLFTVIYLISPFLINSFLIKFIFNFFGDYKLILSDYLLRANQYSDANKDSYDFLLNSLKFSNIFKKILLTAFGYRHIIQSLESSDLLMGISHLLMKISIAFSMVLSYFYIIKNLLIQKSMNLLKSNFVNYHLMLLSANLAAVLIYPYPHDRYMLPGVIFSLIIISNLNKKINSIGLKKNQ